MSIIKAILHQIGLSGDPAKNFTLSVPAAPDGTMKLSRGNAGATTQDIISVSASGDTTMHGSTVGFRGDITQLEGKTTTLANVVAAQTLKGPSMNPGGTTSYSLDASAAIDLAANGSGAFFIDIQNFSGLLVLTNHGTGQIAMALCGQGGVTFVGAASFAGFTLTHNAGISGYTLLNTDAAPKTISVAAIRTRASS